MAVWERWDRKIEIKIDSGREMSGSLIFFFFFKQKTAYEIVSRDWSSDVCSSDLSSLSDWFV